jgi:hypothetical protein
MIKKIFLISCLFLCTGIIYASTISVTNTNDSGAGSLRQAITSAVDGDIINIALSGTITLSSELPIIAKTITINGYSTGTIISGNNVYRIFTVQIPTGTVTFNGLNIQNGLSTIGAASGLYAITGNNGKVVLNRCTFSGCNTTGSEAYGGAIATSADLNLTNCTIYGNTAQSGGGALASLSICSIAILNCTIYNNHSTSATGGGGLDITASAVVSIQNTILAGNTSGVSAVNNDLITSNGGSLSSMGNNLSNTAPFANASDSIGKDLTTKILLSAFAKDAASGMWVCALQDGSVAINHANNTTAPTLDQCGNARVGIADIGAFERQMVVPVITTTSVTVFNATSATFGGNISADGASAVSERGVVYSSTNTAPTIGGTGVTKDIHGTTGTGSFSKSISSLSSNTLYYVQAYATNLAGTSYGGVKSFTTSVGAGLDNPTANALSIYPNPATDGFTLDAGAQTITVSVFDLSGALVLTQQATGKSYIDITSLKKGVYIVKANGLVAKLVKK